MTASTRSQSRQPRSPKRTSPRRQRRPGRPPRSARQRNLQVSRPTAPPPPPLCGRPKALAQARAFCFVLETGDRLRFLFCRVGEEKNVVCPRFTDVFLPPAAESDDPQFHLLDTWRHFLRRTPHSEFDVTAYACLAHTGQAERLQAAVALFHFDHQRPDGGFRKAIDDDGSL